MYAFKKFGNVFKSKFVGTGPSSYEKGIYRATVTQKLRNTDLHHRVIGYHFYGRTLPTLHYTHALILNGRKPRDSHLCTFRLL